MIYEENTRDLILLEDITSLFRVDNTYRKNSLSLTASENYPSMLVRVLGSSLSGGFYHFDPPYDANPGEWYFPDSGSMQELSKKVSNIGMAIFEAETFDWRPNGGSAAEQAVLLGICSRGDGFVHFAHKDGGHFGLESIATKVGIKIYHFPIIEKTLLIDTAKLIKMVYDHPEIKLIILDQSFKLRFQPISKIASELPDSVILTYDCSHDGGLIAGGAFPQPLLQGVDILHGNTHKTIPGPQKGFISFSNKEHPMLIPVSTWICPNMQSNSHSELIAPMLIAFSELASFGGEYARQTIKNAKSFAAALSDEGFFVSGEYFGYTETHQVHLILGTQEKALDITTNILSKSGIRVNNVEIPGSNGAFGLRLGVQAMTRPCS
jgi:glycine hydroxymethyltransferase